MSCAGWAHTYRALDLPAIWRGSVQRTTKAALRLGRGNSLWIRHVITLGSIITAVTVLELDVYKTLMLGEFIQDSNTTV